MSKRSPPPTSSAAAALTCIGPCGPSSSGRHIARLPPWPDSAPSTAKATRSRSPPCAAPSDGIELFGAAPRTMLTGGAPRSSNRTISTLPPGCGVARLPAPGGSTPAPRTTCTLAPRPSPKVTSSVLTAVAGKTGAGGTAGRAAATGGGGIGGDGRITAVGAVLGAPRTTRTAGQRGSAKLTVSTWLDGAFSAPPVAGASPATAGLGPQQSAAAASAIPQAQPRNKIPRDAMTPTPCSIPPRTGFGRRSDCCQPFLTVNLF